jgi:hypothetical protein
MNKRIFAVVLLIGFMLTITMAGTAFAAHPLITDDTGTQGTGKTQLELTGEYGIEKEGGVTTKSLEAPITPFLSYGITDIMDLVVGLPYQRVETEEGGTSSTVRGISDASIELKWRFYERDGLSFAVKPGLSLPTGDENKGLGNGKTSYHAYLITTKDMAPWAFHFNVGYIRNEYKLQADEDANRKDLWHVSLASQVEVAKDLTVVANIGMERNPDKTSDTDPAFILGGFIYAVTNSLDVDFGVKGGLNKPETDYSYIAGITWRF